MVKFNFGFLGEGVNLEGMVFTGDNLDETKMGVPFFLEGVEMLEGLGDNTDLFVGEGVADMVVIDTRLFRSVVWIHFCFNTELSRCSIYELYLCSVYMRFV